MKSHKKRDNRASLTPVKSERKVEKPDYARFPDSLCEKCGRCCMGKVEIEGVVYYTLEHCEHLDRTSNLCNIYDRRFELCPDCITIEEAIEIQALPEDCPYVRELKCYEGVKPFSLLVARYGSQIARMI